MSGFLFYVVVFSVTLLLTYFVRGWVIRVSVMDIPNERSSHSVPTPRGGGIAIAIVWFAAISFLFVLKEIDSNLFMALLCGLPISAIGFIDDLISITPRMRLFVQVCSAALAVFFLGGVNAIDIGFTIVAIPFLFSLLAVVGIVWLTNLFNFLDGIDGYISSSTIFIGLTAAILLGCSHLLLLAVITAGFLVWNWQPAKIFMGDVGSTLLGFTIGVFVIYYQNIGAVSIVIWLMLTSLCWFDASLTLYRRWKNGEELSKAHRKHAYQRLVQSGFSHQKTVLLSLVVSLFVLGLVWLAFEFPAFSVLFLVLNCVYLYFVVRQVDLRFPFQKK